MPSLSCLKTNQLTLPAVHSHYWTRKSGDTMHRSRLLTNVGNATQYSRSQGTGILFDLGINSHTDSRGRLCCVSLISPILQLGKRIIDSFLHLLAALLKGGTVLAKVGRLGRYRKHMTDHLPGCSLLRPNLVAKKMSGHFCRVGFLQLTLKDNTDVSCL